MIPRLVPAYDRNTEALKHGANVGMLELDCSARPGDHLLKSPIMRCLVEILAGEFGLEHTEIVCHDEINFPVRPAFAGSSTLGVAIVNAARWHAKIVYDGASCVHWARFAFPIAGGRGRLS